jgi:NADPH:quinone reductase
MPDSKGTMKAVLLRRFGGPDVLEIVEVATPQPKPGQVLIRVRAAGVNFFETLIRRNRFAVIPKLPTIPGVEVAGVVDALGEGVDPNLLGTRVVVPLFAAGPGSGGYAEYVATKASDIIPLPDDLSFEEATALLVSGLTALYLVRQSSPQGKTVAVTAAGGGVGSLLIQLLKRAGAKVVVAVASTVEKLDLAKTLSVDFAFDYSTPDWIDQVKSVTGGVGADIIYDSVGGTTTKASLAALAPLGELVFSALNRFKLDPSDLEGMFLKNQSLRGFALLPLLNPVSLRNSLSELFSLARAGALRVPVGVRYPLKHVAEAHRALEGRRTIGKVVLILA